VRDIIDAIDEISSFVRGLNFESFRADRRTVKAVLADLSIIGEAARQIPDAIKSSHLSIPWRSMVDIRNVVVHTYFRIDEKIIWETITDDFPTLRRQLWLLIEAPPP